MSNSIVLSKYFLKANLIKYIMILIYLSFSIFFESDFLIIVSFLAPMLLLNFSTPLILKNYFIIYTSLLFFVGGVVFFPNSNYIKIHGLLILCFFSMGYFFSSIVKKVHYLPLKLLKENLFYSKKVSLLKSSILLFFILRLIFVIIKILNTGVLNYFSGSTLVDNIGDYGKGDFNKGINDIVDNFLASIHIILTIIYVAYVFKLNKKLNYLYLTLPFIVIPLLSLSRNAFVFGLILILIIYSFDNKNYGRISRKIFLVFFSTIFVSGFVAMTFGNIRESKITSSEDSKDILMGVFGELSPIIAYNNLNEKIDKLGYQFGYTIFPPLIFKIVPRSWYPDKPINSTAYYSIRYEKESFDQGFMIPTTIYGDLFFNYGFYFSLIIFLFFGFFVNKLDQIYLNSNFDYIHVFIIFYFNFYGLLRNNLPEGLFPLVQGFILYFLLNAFINSVVKYKLKNEKI